LGVATVQRKLLSEDLNTDVVVESAIVIKKKYKIVSSLNLVYVS
jgi:hypothetical protein